MLLLYLGIDELFKMATNGMTMFFMWRHLMPACREVKPQANTSGRWLYLTLLVLTSPVMARISSVIYNILPAWHALWHAFWHDELTYITAPKEAARDAHAEAARDAHAGDKTLPVCLDEHSPLGWWQSQLQGVMIGAEPNLPRDRGAGPRLNLHTTPSQYATPPFQMAHIGLPREVVNCGAAGEQATRFLTSSEEWMLAAFAFVLAHAASQPPEGKEMLVGVAVHNPEGELCIVPVRSRVDQTLNWDQFQKAVAISAHEALARPIPLGALRKACGLPVTLLEDEETPMLVRALFVPDKLDEHELYALFAMYGLPDIQLRVQSAQLISAAGPSGGAAAALHVRSDLYDPELAHAVASRLQIVQRLWASEGAPSDQPLSAWSLVTEEDRAKLLREWVGPSSHFPGMDKTFPSLLEERAAQHPRREAVVWMEGDANQSVLGRARRQCLLTYGYSQQRTRSISYAEMAAATFRLGKAIQELAAHEGGFVALCLQRSPAQIVAVFATLAAGAAYVPIDPEYAAERIEFILADCKPQAILTDEPTKATVLTAAAAVAGELERATLILDMDGQGYRAAAVAAAMQPDALASILIQKNAPTLPRLDGTLDAPAWLCYTSGTFATSSISQ